ncbi:MAG: hypothetical protein QM765_29230 [Myxococcales bacterium]
MKTKPPSRRPWALLTFALAILYPREAHVSGPASLEHPSAHFTVRIESGPSIHFASQEDAHAHLTSERERLLPAAQAMVKELEAGLARLPAVVRGAVLPFDAPVADRVVWTDLADPVERDLARCDYSPFARQLLRARPQESQPAPALPEHAFIFAIPFAELDGSKEVRVSLARDPGKDGLRALAALAEAAVKPTRRVLRRPSARTRVPGVGAAPEVRREGSSVDVRTSRVSVHLMQPGEGPALDELARRLCLAFDREIAKVRDADAREFEGTYSFALKFGAFDVEESPMGGGFTSPYLAERPARAAMTVVLRTVETDEGGPLDAALADWTSRLARTELATIKRFDDPQILSACGPTDWVWVHERR